MITAQQLIKKNRVKKIKKKSLFSFNSPQKKGICLKIYSLKPKKPNSAIRKVTRLQLSDGKIVIGYIPGEGHCLQEHAVALIRGGRVKDLPGVKYHLIRGVYDLNAVSRKTSRSKYGTKTPH